MFLTQISNKMNIVQKAVYQTFVTIKHVNHCRLVSDKWNPIFDHTPLWNDYEAVSAFQSNPFSVTNVANKDSN